MNCWEILDCSTNSATWFVISYQINLGSNSSNKSECSSNCWATLKVFSKHLAVFQTSYTGQILEEKSTPKTKWIMLSRKINLKLPHYMFLDFKLDVLFGKVKHNILSYQTLKFFNQLYNTREWFVLYGRINSLRENHRFLKRFVQARVNGLVG